MKFLSAYLKMGVERHEPPSSVYGPTGDCLRAPLALASESLADAVAALVVDAPRLARMCEASIDLVRERFARERYMAELDAALAALS